STQGVGTRALGATPKDMHARMHAWYEDCRKGWDAKTHMSKEGLRPHLPTYGRGAHQISQGRTDHDPLQVAAVRHGARTARRPTSVQATPLLGCDLALRRQVDGASRGVAPARPTLTTYPVRALQVPGNAQTRRRLVEPNDTNGSNSTLPAA